MRLPALRPSMSRPRAAVPSARPDWKRRLDEIRANRSEGAGPLAQATLAVLARELRRPALASPATTRSFATEVTRELARTQPAMAVFGEWSRDWRGMRRTTSGNLLGRVLRRWVRRWNDRIRAEPARIGRVVARRMPPKARVLTLSHSSTVARAFLSLPASRRPREVIALESRPGGEGRSLVRELRRGGLPARWVPDRAMPRVVAAADLVVLGADTVEANGDLVHKVGTRALVAEAWRMGVPVVVIAGRSKWRTGPAAPGRLPRRFDRTPARGISEYWTDLGVRRPAGRAARASQRR